MIGQLRLWANVLHQHLLIPNSTTAKLARGTLWSLLGTVGVQSFSMLAGILTARMLGQVGFGEYGVINSTIGMFGIFAGVGLGLTTTKYVAEWRTKDPERAGKIIGLSIQVAAISSGLISLALFVTAPWLATNTLNAPHLVDELRIACVLLFLNALNGLQIGVLSGFEAFKRIAKINLWRGMLNLPIMVAGVWLFGLTGAIIAMALTAAIGWWISEIALRYEYRRIGLSISYSGLSNEFPILWQYSLPAFLSNIFVTPFLWYANTLIASLPSGYAELGLLGVANQWRNVLLLLPRIVGSVSLPMMSSDQEATESFGATFETAQSIAILASVPASASLLVLSPWVMGLYGSDFVAGVPLFVAMLAGVSISAIGGVAGPAMQAKGYMWLGAIQNLTWGLIYVGFTFLMVGRWGGMALAAGFTVANLVLTLWGYIHLAVIHLVTWSTVVRTLSACTYIIVIAGMAMVTPDHLRLFAAILLFLLSLALSAGVWSSISVRHALWRVVSIPKTAN